MTANKMPEMPEGLKLWLTPFQQSVFDEYVQACYLAGIAAARECVPGAFTQIDYIKHRASAAEAAGHNYCRTATLTNLTALEQEAKK